jgi:hypothetical protein
MAKTRLVPKTPARKPPTVIGAFPSKLLHDCTRCGRPVFKCRGALSVDAVVDVEVLERPTGDVAIQACIGSDELAAVVVASPRTFYRLHLPHCKGAFSATQLRKVRP